MEDVVGEETGPRSEEVFFDEGYLTNHGTRNPIVLTGINLSTYQQRFSVIQLLYTHLTLFTKPFLHRSLPQLLIAAA